MVHIINGEIVPDDDPRVQRPPRAAAGARPPSADDDDAGPASAHDTAAARLFGAAPAAASRPTFDRLAAPLALEWGYTGPGGGGGLPAVPSTVDLEAGGASVGAANAGGEPLLEPVALTDRITLEFRDVDCYVPRLFGAGAPGGALTRSVTLLRGASSGGPPKEGGDKGAGDKAAGTRQVRRRGGREGGWVGRVRRGGGARPRY